MSDRETEAKRTYIHCEHASIVTREENERFNENKSITHEEKHTNDTHIQKIDEQDAWG